MKILDDLVDYWEPHVPMRHIGDDVSSDHAINWHDYNYPSFFPLIHFDKY